MEDDLISRSALLDTIYGDKRPEVYDGQDIANWQMECIECAHAVDAEPVRHGRWIKKINPRWPAYSHDCCSVCGWWNTRNARCYDSDHKPGHSLNYCPNCGSKMDLE